MLLRGKGSSYILYCVCTEVTLPFVEMRWFLQEALSVATPTVAMTLNVMYMINGAFF